MSTLYQFCIFNDDPAQEIWTDASALGIESIRRTRVHAGLDTLRLTLTGQTALTDAPIWVYKTVIRFRRVDEALTTLLFLGRVQPFARAGSGSEETTTVEVRGIWEWFEKTTMRASWRQTGATGIYAPHVVLFSNGSGGRIKTGAQLTAAVNTAISAGCPVQLGTIPAGFYPPYDEQINLSVADAIVTCLANHPHSCLWIDYTTRLPTLNVATRGSLSSFTAAVTSDDISIMARDDLRPSAVAIAYISTNTDGDRSYIQTTIDHAPTVAGETASVTEARLYAVDTLWGTFEMEGSSAQYLEQELKVEAVDWDTNKTLAAWWQGRVPGIADATVISIDNPLGETDLPNFIIEGSVAPWMTVEYASETFTADATLTRSNAAGIVEKKIEKISFTATTTDGINKTYKKRISYDSGEIPPEGLAAAMWAEWDQLHYDGAITITDQEAPQGCGPGMTINLTGGRPEWIDMQAMIISVEEDYASGSLSVIFGVPEWISLDSRMAWIRNCRTRRYSWARNMQEGTEENPESASGPMAGAASEAGIQPTVFLRQRWVNPTATLKHEVDINLDDITETVTKRIVKLREMVIPYKLGDTTSAKLAQVLCSEGYGDPIPLGGLPAASAANQVLGTDATKAPIWRDTITIDMEGSV